MSETEGLTITLLDNGPYQVSGPRKLLDCEGGEWDTADRAAVYLCRCGGSENKPFCDGTHSRLEFAAEERATPVD